MAKRSSSKESRGGAKSAVRRHKPTGTAVEEVVHRRDAVVEIGEHDRVLPVDLVKAGEPVAGLPSLAEAREHLRRNLVAIPWEGLKLSRGEPAIPTTFID